MPTRTLPLASAFAFASIALAAACSGRLSGSPPPADAEVAEAGMPFQADPPSVYVAKVKDILLGLPPTDAEIQQVSANPSQLAALIQGWQSKPQYEAKMQRFFELAFQQTQVSLADFSDQAYPQQIAANAYTSPLLVQNAQESLARTMIYFTQQGEPLTFGVTTHQLMMTTALKELYAFLDVWEVDDNGTVRDAFADGLAKSSPGTMISVESSLGPILPADTLTVGGPQFLEWYDPDVGTANASIIGCQQPVITYKPRALTLQYLLYGTLETWYGQNAGQQVKCLQYGGSAGATQFQPSDFDDWTLVTIRQPAPNEATTLFYDLAALRAANELVLTIPRTGFFSTPAFFANWQTNTSNTMRVTINQALIVALGASVDGTDPTVPPSTPGLDAAHAAQPACYGCHKLLDPTRSIFASTWSWNYHNQIDPTESSQPGLFAFHGVINPNVHTLDDLAHVLVTHPLFAPAWVEKLCYYANSSACDPTDPLFTKIVGDFQASNYNWNSLVVELLSSPMVTNASETATAEQNGEVVAVSRRDHLCAALSARLGLADPCGLEATTSVKYDQTTLPLVASGLPSDAYGRGTAVPVLPNQPTLFFRAGMENICESVAADVIDPEQPPLTATTKWSSTNPTPAIADFVTLIMAIEPSDPRYGQAIAILTNHFTQASQQSGINATAALRSTFVAACLSPSAVGIGM